ncbi:unnamed protein product [Parascedosporium putredinis]|uniref:Uncharacterized protein n=1 Tax=Parascedosporium putredinis TaxID=1442378 RepID=A0A9P1MF33_9PEZI|nr:unnamed protein product [Parascedosporium putredinis]CAI8001693.1 unnamed protein product [Parascedosporium putredinis]
MVGRLAGKVALVTGGASGYGLGIAKKLKAEGATVIIADLSATLGTQAAGELEASFIEANVAERSSWEAILNTAINQHGGLDIVINNAGACYLKKPTETVTESEYDLMMNVNVKALFLSVSVIVPYLLSNKRKAVFVSVSSVSGVRPRPELTWYSASKAAINTASNSMAVEYAPNGIRFNTVCPAIGLTSMTDILTDAQKAEMSSAIPLGRSCTPRDVANAIAYLASDEADFITGVNLQVCL